MWLNPSGKTLLDTGSTAPRGLDGREKVSRASAVTSLSFLSVDTVWTEPAASGSGTMTVLPTHTELEEEILSLHCFCQVQAQEKQFNILSPQIYLHVGMCAENTRSMVSR